MCGLSAPPLSRAGSAADLAASGRPAWSEGPRAGRRHGAAAAAAAAGEPGFSRSRPGGAGWQRRHAGHTTGEALAYALPSCGKRRMQASQAHAALQQSQIGYYRLARACL